MRNPLKAAIPAARVFRERSALTGHRVWDQGCADSWEVAILSGDRQRELGATHLDIVWDGIVATGVLGGTDAELRRELADQCKLYNWTHVLAILGRNPELVNTTRPGGASLFAPLHQAAHGGAPPEVARALIKLGGWRTLQNARGERPLDVAVRRGHRHLLAVMKPRLRRFVPIGVLLKIQSIFHDVILGRAAEEVARARLRLPELEPLLELDRQNVWFAIPGMAGSFSYQLESDGVEALLVTESWCRLVDGSGQRHEVTSAGSRLVAEGFV